MQYKVMCGVAKMYWFQSKEASYYTKPKHGSFV